MEPLKKTTSYIDKEGMGITSGISETASGVSLEDRKILDAREKAFVLQNVLQRLDKEDQLEIEIEHHFCDGVYARTMYMPEGSVIVGKTHKYRQLNILSKGDVTVSMEDGPIRVQAGFHMVCPSGAKRVFYAHEDSIWTLILHTHETDVDKIEEHFVVETEEEYMEHIKLIGHTL